MATYSFIFPLILQSIHLFFHPSPHLPFHLPVNPSIYPFIHPLISCAFPFSRLLQTFFPFLS